MDSDPDSEDLGPAAEGLVLWWKIKEVVRDNQFIFLKLLSVMIGLMLGIILTFTTELDSDSRWFRLLKLPGEILINSLQLVSVPLVVTSIITSAALQLPHYSFRKAGRALTFFMATTTSAVLIGLVTALIFKPGSAFAHEYEREEDAEPLDVVNFLFDLVCNLFPENFFIDGYYMYQTKNVYLDDHGNPTSKENATMQGLVGELVDGPNIMGLIMWSFIFGIALKTLGARGAPMIELLDYWNTLIKGLVDIILWYLPFGMVFVIATSVVEIEDWSVISQLGMFIFTVIVGLFLQCLVVVFIYGVVTKHNPYKVLKKMGPALLTALFISSSSATLPITMQVCEAGLHIDKKVSRIILPIGTSINKDGTAVYEVVAVLFIAQLNSIQLSLVELITVCMVAFVTSIGAPSIPATGAASTRLVLASVGLPGRDSVLLLPVEWVLDRLNTMVNVLGDCYGTEVVYELMLKDHVRHHPNLTPSTDDEESMDHNPAEEREEQEEQSEGQEEEGEAEEWQSVEKEEEGEEQEEQSEEQEEWADAQEEWTDAQEEQKETQEEQRVDNQEQQSTESNPEDSKEVVEPWSCRLA